ncbi:MAG TPA: PspC domain-containing protein [Candidatus Kapabacteria bacterium]|jgi:phage shock protein C|nr:PspC domain-containing protein [Candidatus Kapabacteria bacterium]HOV92337.1 PspC domain-containing protein [Candidatus Kapabacteria bacterium]
MKIVQRSRNHRIVAGVCGGLGEYFDIDPVFIRLLFVIVSFFYGIGVVAYIVLWIIIPSTPMESAYMTSENPSNPHSDYDNKSTENIEVEDDSNIRNKNTQQVRIFIGSILLLIGVLILLNELVPNIKGELIWSFILIILGIFLIILSLKKKKENEN